MQAVSSKQKKNHEKGQKIFMTPYCTEEGVTEASRCVMMASEHVGAERNFGCRVLLLNILVDFLMRFFILITFKFLYTYVVGTCIDRGIFFCFTVKNI